MLKVKMTSDAYNKLRYFVQECEDEISGFGKVRVLNQEVTEEYEDVELGFNRPLQTYEEKAEATVLEIYDIEILKQNVSSADAEIDEEELARFLTEKIKKGENPEEYKLWWHSHAAMKTFFSITDVTTINDSKEFPWLLSLVTNHEGNIECRLDLYQPLRLTIEDLEVEISPSENPEIRKQCKREIARKVKREPYNPKSWYPRKGKKNVELILD